MPARYFASGQLIKFLVTCFCVLSFITACKSDTASAGELKVGDLAPEFELSTYEGEKVALSSYKGKIVVLEWFNRGCPYVVNHYEKGHMQKLQKDYKEKDVVWLIINSTHERHKDYLSATKAAKVRDSWEVAASAMLVDADGKVGKSYGAKTTPHMFIIDPEGKIAYSGAIDDGDDYEHDPAAAKNYVREGLEQLLAGSQLEISNTSPYGCSVKYAT